MKGEVIDPATGLPTDLAFHVGLLGDLVRAPKVQRSMIERKVANVAGLSVLLGMLNATQERLGQGWSPAWWIAYGKHVREHLSTVLEDKEVRRECGLFLAWQRGATYKAVLKELRALQRELKSRIEMEAGAKDAGIILVES
jgi:hypothetical protein